MGVYDVLKDRGFIYQLTHEEQIKKDLDEKKLHFYIGFDPTADSLTVGGLLPIMTAAHMQQHGHVPIILFGGATGLIGDPTGKSELRKMLTREQINHNIECFKKQVSNFIDFSDGKALVVNNADWTCEMNYIDFLRDYGIYFSVNKMLAADSNKTRLENGGLTFLEFNYMIMQAFDYLHLYKNHNCTLQMGGSDQWSNILAGVDLVRRVEEKEVHGLTINLLLNSQGQKMGKTASGAVWLDREKTKSYELYQYFRNVDDADVIKLMKLLTFMPIDEIAKYAEYKDAELNKAKERLAFEITKIVHGEADAIESENTTKALFGDGIDLENAPTTEIADINITIIEALEITKLIPSRSEGRRLIQQGGVKLNDVAITDISYTINENDFVDGKAIIKKGKKSFHVLKRI